METSSLPNKTIVVLVNSQREQVGVLVVDHDLEPAPLGDWSIVEMEIENE